jgi:hypothetical protein
MTQIKHEMIGSSTCWLFIFFTSPLLIRVLLIFAYRITNLSLAFELIAEHKSAFAGEGSILDHGGAHA